MLISEANRFHVFESIQNGLDQSYSTSKYNSRSTCSTTRGAVYTRGRYSTFSIYRLIKSLGSHLYLSGTQLTRLPEGGSFEVIKIILAGYMEKLTSAHQ